MIAAAFVELAAVLSIRQTTRLLGVSRAKHYRKDQPPAERKARPVPANKLSDAETAHVLSVLRSPRFRAGVGAAAR